MTQQWHTRITGEMAADGTTATLEVTGDGDKGRLIQLADDLKMLGFVGRQVLRPAEETQS